MRSAWEFLLPCEHDGILIPQEVHEAWKREVEAFTEATLIRSSEDVSVSSNGSPAVHMVVVRILCRPISVYGVIAITKRLYSIEKVTAYEVSKRVIAE